MGTSETLTLVGEIASFLVMILITGNRKLIMKRRSLAPVVVKGFAGRKPLFSG